MDTQLNLHKAAFESQLTLRNVRWEDLDRVAKLIYDVCAADGDVTVATPPADLKNWWQTSGFDISKDAFVVETQDGKIAGYEELTDYHAHAHLDADGYVHPQFKGLGIGTMLIRAAETRAMEHLALAEPGLRVFIRVTTDSKDEVGKAMFAYEGYSVIRHHWRMEINLTEAPPAPVFPAAIELRPFVKEEHARAVWEADNEAFRDHWGSHEIAFEEWQHKKFDKEGFDPTLWMIAWDGDQIAGFSQNRYRAGIGWIGTLGVRRPWRKLGLGQALLTHSFGEFYKRGMTTIGLGVDASNPTGATRLYRRVGMGVASEFVTFEKELRPGISESNDSEH